MNRFRWTRAKYRKASQLARFFGRYVRDLPSEPPPLLQCYLDLWSQHPQRKDPLSEPVQVRLAWYTEMPF